MSDASPNMQEGCMLPFNTEELLHGRTVESNRIEFKSTYDDEVARYVVATVAAFANDLHNLNGGYVVIGVIATEGVPELPPVGIEPSRLEDVQRHIRVSCRRIDPEFQPVLCPVVQDGRHVLVAWCPAGDNRPYRCPDPRNPGQRAYFVRLGPETVKAQGEVERQLLELTARVPFDDRRHASATVLDLSPILVKRFLQEVNSDLLSVHPLPDDMTLYKSLRIVTEAHGTYHPKNSGLLFFNERPDRFMPCVVFDVVQFADDAGGNLIEEKRFSGPLDTQVQAVVDYLDNMTNIQLRKVPGRQQVERAVAYPYEALEEAIVNAVYHRSYENCAEPDKVYLYPNRLEVISYPGPVTGITLEHLKGPSPVPPVPARNRRIGEFLKELRLAEMRGTGIPKIRRAMLDNGSESPTIDFDTDRSYFRVVLPAHPRYKTLHALRESSYLWSIGERKSAVDRLTAVLIEQPGAGAVAAQLISFHGESGNLSSAEQVFRTYHRAPIKYETEQPYLRYFKVLFGANEKTRAKEVMELLPHDAYYTSTADIAVAFKRLKIHDKAHSLMLQAFAAHDGDPEFVHNFAQVKMAIALDMAHSARPQWHTVTRLRREAVALLRRVIGMSNDPVDCAWAYYDLARTLSWLKNTPESQVREAYEQAIATLPSEPAFRQGYDIWRRRHLARTGRQPERQARGN